MELNTGPGLSERHGDGIGRAILISSRRLYQQYPISQTLFALLGWSRWVKLQAGAV
jgi:hypothetical protein